MQYHICSISSRAMYIPNTFIFSPGLTSDNIDIVWDGKHFTKLSELKRYLSEVM